LDEGKEVFVDASAIILRISGGTFVRMSPAAFWEEGRSLEA
jgi:hypothetical protein